MIKIAIRELEHHRGLPLPAYQSALAAGMDLAAALPENQPLTLTAGHWAAIPCGLEIELPADYEAQVRPRSGLALKNGVTVLNAPGTIDADYRGEIKVILINHSTRPFVIERGMRIAQLVIAPVTQVSWQVSDVLSESERGAGGFGSSGV